jgi:hypothetical protein
MIGNQRRPRRGNVLVEFAFMSFVLYLLLAGILDFGRAMFAAQVSEQAADFIAREISRTPLPPNDSLAGLYDPTDPSFADWAPVRQNVYSEDFLVIDITAWVAGGSQQTIVDYVNSLSPAVPSGNKALLPLMIVQTSLHNSSVPSGKTFLMYPGALVSSSSAPSGFTIRIPQVSYASGSEQIAPQSGWLHVVQAMSPDPFPLVPASSTSAPAPNGLVQLQLNYPFQAVALTQSATNSIAFTQGLEGQTPAQVSDSSGTFGPYSGPEGLGEQAAYARVVRPYRQILSFTAMYRREIFSAAPTSP